ARLIRNGWITSTKWINCVKVFICGHTDKMIRYKNIRWKALQCLRKWLKTSKTKWLNILLKQRFVTTLSAKRSLRICRLSQVVKKQNRKNANLTSKENASAEMSLARVEVAKSTNIATVPNTGLTE